jgi:hypothetical protein
MMSTQISKVSLVVVVAMSWFAVISNAQQARYPDMTQQADAIVVGKLRAAESTASENLQLLVDRMIKGLPVVGQTLNIIAPGVRLRRAPGQPWGDYGIWFLRSTGTGEWTIIRVTGSKDFESACYRLPEGTASQHASTVDGNPPLPLDVVLAELTSAAETFDPFGFEFALIVDNFQHMPPSDSLTATYQRMSQSTKVAVKALGTVGLFRDDAASLEQIPVDPAILDRLPVIVRAPLISNIRAVRDPSPATIAALGRMITTRTIAIGIRICAAESFAKIHTKETLPLIATLLDADDAELRNWAFSGFSRFVNNLPIEKGGMVTNMAWMQPQGPAPYRTKETDGHISDVGVPLERHAEYTSFWKAWWSRMQNQIN